MSDLQRDLKSLGFHYCGEHLDDLLALATKKRLTPRQIFEHVVHLENQERARRSLERRLSRSRLGPFKPMADFEWDWPTKIARADVEAALELDFLERERNLVLVAAEGLGKTMIARNIIHNAILTGRSALFISAAELLLDLGGQDSARGLDRRLKHYARIGLLAIDEIGYLSYDVRNADLLFQLVSMRYEKKPLVLTTNIPRPLSGRPRRSRRRRSARRWRCSRARARTCRGSSGARRRRTRGSRRTCSPPRPARTRSRARWTPWRTRTQGSAHSSTTRRRDPARRKRSARLRRSRRGRSRDRSPAPRTRRTRCRRSSRT